MISFQLIMASIFCQLKSHHWSCFRDEQLLEGIVINIGVWFQEIQFSYLKITGTYSILISRTFATLGQWIFSKEDSALGKRKEYWIGIITAGSKPQLSLTRCSTDYPASPDQY